MRMIFTATQRSVAKYGCPAWAPWISRSGMEKIETAQRRAARRCTGATLSTPVEAVNREAGLEDQRVRYQQMESEVESVGGGRPAEGVDRERSNAA